MTPQVSFSTSRESPRETDSSTLGYRWLDATIILVTRKGPTAPVEAHVRQRLVIDANKDLLRVHPPGRRPDHAPSLVDGEKLQIRPDQEGCGSRLAEGGALLMAQHHRGGVKRNMVIPEGYRLHASAGVELDLTHSAKIVSYSPILFVGAAKEPIIITSSDATGQGIAVLQAKRKSIFNHVIFKNLSAPSEKRWRLSGAITFYESPVYFSDCRFLDNRKGDDLLNIIRSPFTIENCLFKNSVIDALDVDFSKGRIRKCDFLGCGVTGNRGDGMDFSGSAVEIESVFLDGIGDKAISIGEKSTVKLIDVDIRRARVAVASKDESRVSIERLNIRDSRIGMVVFQKKAEFGPSGLAATHVSLSGVDTPWLLEPGSWLTIDEVMQIPNQTDVRSLLYGKN